MAEPNFDFSAFERSLAHEHPPEQAPLALRALWYDAKGMTESAFRAASRDPMGHSARVLGYLHRKAENATQAQIWYWKAGCRPWDGSFDAEWLDIVQNILIEFPVASAYGG